jgi:hypothetical protein
MSCFCRYCSHYNDLLLLFFFVLMLFYINVFIGFIVSIMF